uniref:Immunoglobulin V-set domain-containing protein n=1 Tax=Oreochromis aureus TaxID=47969 RepID=A0AAZ1XY34_OREAU
FFIYIYINFNLLYITTVSEVSVKAGKSISIPCLYESQYKNHVKYLCEGYDWTFCKYAVKTNEADPSGKYLISDDKKLKIFTVTINHGLKSENSGWYWCAKGDIQIPVYLNVTVKPITSEYCKISNKIQDDNCYSTLPLSLLLLLLLVLLFLLLFILLLKREQWNMGKILH